MEIQRLTHLGLCVSDLERSLRFYCGLFGFEEVHRLDLSGEAVSKLNEMEDVVVTSVFLERDGWRLELMAFDAPDVVASNAPTPLNRLGFTHIAFRVRDLDAVCDAIEAHGGGILRASEIALPGPTRAIMVHDPDGQRIELLEAPGDPNALPMGPARR